MGNSKKKKARRAKKGSGPVANGTDALRNTIAAPEDILALNDRTFASPNFTGDLFRQEVQVRARRERKPMHWAKRVKTRITAFKMRKQIQQELEIDAAAESRFQNTQREIVDTPVSFEKLPRKQYTVTSKARYNRLLCHIDPDHFSYSPSGAMVKYINWTFKSGFSVVFLSFVVIFLLLVFLFGVIFKYAGEAKPQCIIVAGDSFGSQDASTTLADGFALSWTTFTTVGYGAVYTATGNDHIDQKSCMLVTLLSTAESFIGLLYAGICTAIMFGKIGRIQSHAQVTFSDAVCVEYGQTEDDAQTPSKRNLEDLEPSNSTTKRSMSGMSMEIHESIPEESENDYSATEGEYSEDDSDHEESQVIPKSPQVGVRTPNRPPLRKKTQIMCPVIKFQLVNQLSNEAGGEILDANMSVMVRKEKESYPYEPIARFLRVNMEEPTHPYFNRVWHGRHILDADSPLLSVAARKRIRLNGGFWPEDLNNPESVRNHLRFSSVIIIMTGISNISAESVQISKRYYKDDVLIGYDFAPLLYQKEGSEMLRVDMNLINDVVEQSIGSAETLAGDDLSRPTLREHDMRDIITSNHSSKGYSSNSIRSFSSLRPSSAASEPSH